MPKYPSWLNPKNWFVDDLSDKKDFSEAFKYAREKKMDEFLYQDKRFKTDVAPPKNLSNNKTFNHAFRSARDQKLEEFEYKGKRYNTQLVDPFVGENYNVSKSFLNNYLSKATLNLSKEDSLSLERDPEFMRDLAKRKKEDAIAFLNAPAYFSITDAPRSDDSDGFFDRGENKIHITDADLTVPVHELTHKSGLTVVSNDIDKLRKIYRNNKNREKSEIPNDEFFDYVSLPQERAARHLSTLYYLDQRGHKFDKFSKNEYGILKKNYGNLPYDVRQLIDLYGDESEFVNQMNAPLGFNPFNTYYGKSKKAKNDDPLGILD